MWATIPMFRMRSKFRIMSGMAFANSARIWVMDSILTRRLGDALDLFLAAYGEARQVSLRRQRDLGRKAGVDGLRRLSGCLDRSHRDVPNRDGDAPGWGSIHGARHRNSPELEASDLLSGCGVLDGVHQELERVLCLMLREFVEGEPDRRERFRLLPRALPPFHQVVRETLHEVHVDLHERAAGELALGVGSVDRMEVEVRLDAGVVDLDSLERV